MSVAIHCVAHNGEKVMVPIVGQAELMQVWMPIIQARHLDLVEICISAGLSIDETNYDRMCRELADLRVGIEATVDENDRPGNPIYRCRRLEELLLSHPPDSNANVYIG